MSETVRLTIKISRDTDLFLRGFLGARGMKKGDLSRFVEEAIRWRILDQTVQEIKERNLDLSPETLEAAIDEAVREVRSERRDQI
ncbi:MAG: ribbon-helix-helix domain-containing protein [Methylohalobius crimeensis]|uniref:ribbon-helix-helix domain-containing protein n=1 Tax=Methylohalobius crimeensis TaxID=244365 RepID=UPI0003B7B05B|nr:ribbon-helix-helix domain-containing protein [Methylohalobius crimeensis]